jgi:hypothetical protein
MAGVIIGVVIVGVGVRASCDDENACVGMVGNDTAPFAVLVFVLVNDDEDDDGALDALL